VDNCIPDDDRDAGAVSIAQFMQIFLDHGWQVYLWPFDQIDRPERRTALLQKGIRVVLSSRRADGLHLWLHRNAGLLQVVFLSRPALTAYLLPGLKERHYKLVYYGHDLHAERFAQEATQTRHPELKVLAAIYGRMERRICREVDFSYYPSAQEVQALQSCEPQARIRELPPYAFDFNALPPASPSPGAQILFIGNFGHVPNVDAATWLLDEIWPLLQQQVRESRLVIAGSSPPASLIQRAQSCHETVTITGWVSNDRLQEYYQSSRIVVVPLRFGAGVKHKVVAAVVHGCPIVSTETGLQGLPELQHAVGLAYDATDFASHCQILIADDQLCQSRIQSARTALANRFSTQSMWSAFHDVHC
jgi:glycosyltransferase involved in cell wall biosynthesis